MLEDKQKLCNVCDQPMKQRTKQTGTDAGVEFWVCSRFPECRTFEKCEPAKVQKPGLAKIATGDQPRKLNNIDQKEQPYAMVALFFGSAVFFAVIVTGAIKIDLTKIIFGEIGKRTTETGLIDYTQAQSVAVQPVAVQPVHVTEPTKTIEQPKPENTRTGAFYQYTDKNGIMTMVNDIEKVPNRYRANMKVSGGNDMQRTSVIVRNNQVYVPVTIGYRGKMVTVQVILDTGATNTTISPALAKRLGIKFEDTVQGSSILADGRRVVNYNAAADFVAVGPKTKKALQIQILPNESGEETGLLGMNFLADFPHMIDVKSQVIKWM